MDEEKEIIEAKSKIDKEVEETEARFTKEQEVLHSEIEFFSIDSEEVEIIRKRIAPIKKDLAELKWLQKFGEERLSEIRKKKIQERAENQKLTAAEKMKLASLINKARFLHRTTTFFRRKLMEQERAKIKRYETLDNILSELVKKSNKRSREQLKIILKKWEKRILFVDKLYRAGKNTSNGFIPKEEKQEDAERLNKHIRTRPEPLLYYLYRSGQLKDLTKKDIKGINEWVKTKRREDPFCNVREIK